MILSMYLKEKGQSPVYHQITTHFTLRRIINTSVNDAQLTYIWFKDEYNFLAPLPMPPLQILQIPHCTCLASNTKQKWYLLSNSDKDIRVAHTQTFHIIPELSFVPAKSVQLYAHSMFTCISHPSVKLSFHPRANNWHLIPPQLASRSNLYVSKIRLVSSTSYCSLLSECFVKHLW